MPREVVGSCIAPLKINVYVIASSGLANGINDERRSNGFELVASELDYSSVLCTETLSGRWST
jgi:hypothetical protein